MVCWLQLNCSPSNLKESDRMKCWVTLTQEWVKVYDLRIRENKVIRVWGAQVITTATRCEKDADRASTKGVITIYLSVVRAEELWSWWKPAKSLKAGSLWGVEKENEKVRDLMKMGGREETVVGTEGAGEQSKACRLMFWEAAEAQWRAEELQQKGIPGSYRHRYSSRSYM